MQYDCERENQNVKKIPLVLHNPIFQNVHTSQWHVSPFTKKSYFAHFDYIF